MRFGDDAAPVSTPNEGRALTQLIAVLKRRLEGYRTTIKEDGEIIKDPTTGPRQTVAARLLRIEKGILQGALEQALAQPGAAEAASADAGDAGGVKFV